MVSTCHQVGNDGHPVGPPLAGSLNRPDQALLAQLLDPSREIASGYQSYLVITKDGRMFHGVLKSDSATSIALRIATGEFVEILRRDIDTFRASELSLMPSNLQEQMSPVDMANLLSYLRTTLTGPTKTAGTSTR